MMMKLTLLPALLALSAFFTSHVIVSAKDYEYIVVGAGSSGSIVAGELARRGKSVLLLEEGGDDSDPVVENMADYFNILFNPGYDYLRHKFQSVAQSFAGVQGGGTGSREIDLPQGKVFGGSHAINAAAFVHGNAADFDNIAQTLGDRSWSWRSLATYRTRLSKTLDILTLGASQTGGQAFINTARTVLGFPYNANPNSGKQNGIGTSFWTGSLDATRPAGERSTSFDAFARPQITGSLDVISFHRVEELLFDPNAANRVLGVTTVNLRTTFPIATEFYATKEVIISAGTYNTPQLLMLSGIGPADLLTAHGVGVRINVPGVGQNLRDHYGVGTFYGLGSLPPETPFLFQSPTFNMFGPEPTGPTKYQFELSGNFGSVIPLRQTSVGTVTLQSNSANDNPVINPNVLSTPEDFQALFDGLKNYILPFFKSLIAQGVNTPGNLDVNASDETIAAFVRANVSTNHHPVGTSKVGPTSDPMAVVDANFRVRGMTNLRVIDASVFPLCPSGNTNASTMTIALLGVDKILGKGVNQNNQGNQNGQNRRALRA